MPRSNGLPIQRPHATLPPHARRSMFVGLLLATFLVATSSTADEVQTCIDAHAQAQVARKEGRLREARDKLLTCAEDACPAMLRKDCGPWLTEVTHSLPTVVVLAKDPDGADLLDVRVLFDGKELTTELDGMAIEVDPGVHTFRFETKGEDPVEKKVVIREGEKNHELSVQFGTPKPTDATSTPPSAHTPPEADIESSRPVPPLVYVLGTVGLAGLGTSAYFEASGMSKKGDLDDQGCKPYCQQADVDAAKRDILIGDVALGVGLASLGTATYVYLSRPTTTAEKADRDATLDVRHLPGGALATVRGHF